MLVKILTNLLSQTVKLSRYLSKAIKQTNLLPLAIACQPCPLDKVIFAVYRWRGLDNGAFCKELTDVKLTRSSDCLLTVTTEVELKTNCIKHFIVYDRLRKEQMTGMHKCIHCLYTSILKMLKV